MNRVFVSYSRRNKTFAERLARDLDDAGLDVWVDWRQIQVGEFWRDEIFRGIERSDILVICLSPPAVQSEWVQREVITARDQGKTILPVMVESAIQELEATDTMRWLLDIQFINFENQYEAGLVALLDNLPGRRPIRTFDVFEETNIPNPFKGLEAFQQTDSHFFFGRANLIQKSLDRLQQERTSRFLAVVGASGSGKSSLVRAGIIPKIRAGALPNSDQWRIAIFTPGEAPVNALAQRLAPLVATHSTEEVNEMLHKSHEAMTHIVQHTLSGAPDEARLLIVVDQFEEVFTRAGEHERERFLKIIHHAVTEPNVRAYVLITMRADFFDRLSRYPELAALVEQENLVITTEMTSSELLRSIEGPAEAVRLVYDRGLPQRILDDVQRQPGSLPLLQYALKELFDRREGNRLTTAAYESIGGVQGALAQRAEDIYTRLNAAQQGIMRRVLLRLVEVSETGEATRRSVDRQDLTFKDVPDEAVQDVLDRLLAADARLLIASREIKASTDETQPTVWIEVGHEALIRRWSRFTGWVAENMETLRYGTEILQSAQDWQQANRDASYLLTGSRLARAESWLDEADPTELQRAFVQASLKQQEIVEARQQAQIQRELVLRKQSQQRLRLVIGVLILSLLVAIGAGVVTLNSLQQAEAARDAAEAALEEAELNEAEARSFALASSADRSLDDNDTELAVLLAVEANLVSESPSAEAQRVLSEVAYAPGVRTQFANHPGVVVDAIFSPDGTLAVSTVGNTIYVWEITTRALRRTIDSAEAGHTGGINRIAFSPDGGRLITGGNDDRLIVWDIETGNVLANRNDHTGDVNDVAYSPDGTTFASAGNDGTVILWAAEAVTPLQIYNDHSTSVEVVKYSDDGSQIISVSNSGQVIVFDTASYGARTLLNNETNTVSADYDSLNQRVVLGAADGVIQVYSAIDGELIWQEDLHDDIVTDLAFSYDRLRLVSSSADGGVIHWDAATGTIVNTFDGYSAINGVDAHPARSRILSAGADGVMRLWDLRNAQEIDQYAGHTEATIAVYGPDDLTVLSGSADGTLRLWNTVTGLTIQEFVGHTDRVSDIVMTSDGSRAISASWDNTLIIWDAASGQPLHILAGHTSRVQTLAISPDDTWVISGATDGEVIVWDVATGQLIHRYPPAVDKDAQGHLARINDIATSPDSTRAISVSDDETIIVWDIINRSILYTFDVGQRIRSVVFGLDGLSAVTGDSNGVVALWDLNPDSPTFGTTTRAFDGHTRPIFGVDFAPDGDSVISGSLDGTLRLWELESGFELRRYTVDSSANAFINSVDFSADGRSVVTGMSDASIREWRILLDLDDLLSWTFSNRFIREPDCDERQLFNIQPFCESTTTALAPIPTRTPFPLPTLTPTSEALILSVGDIVRVNTASGDTLNMRSAPTVVSDDNIVTRLDDNQLVTLLEGPIASEGFIWWRVQAENGQSGWVVESVPAEGLQTLVP